MNTRHPPSSSRHSGEARSIMATGEDCASVLEQFIHDVANLPAEINHMMEEIQAKDKEMQKHLATISSKDANIQKHVKTNGSLVPHPKEKEYVDAVVKNFDLCRELQDQKVGLSDKACALLDRQIKKLDIKIRELQSDGQLADGPPIPSIFNQKLRQAETPSGLLNLPIAGQLPLQATSSNALNMNMAAHRLNSQHGAAPHLAQSIPRHVAQAAAAGAATAGGSLSRSSGPSTPSSALNQQRHQREHSAGAVDGKRRKLNSALAGANLPAQPSTLRQSSLGPGTPKAGTPTGTSAGGRAGSLPRSTQQSGSGGGSQKKASGLSKRVAPHQQISKLKGKPVAKHHARLSSSSAGGGTGGARGRKGQSPSVRGAAAAAAATRDGTDDNDSVLSSASPSDTDVSQTQRSSSRRAGATTAASGGTAGGPTGGITTHGLSTTKQSKAAAAAAAAAHEPRSSSRSSNRNDGDEDEDNDEDEDEEDEEEDDDQEDDRRYCICNERSYGEMVACENDKCPYEWFHLACIGMKRVPDEAEVWYCPECRGKPEIVALMKGKGK